MLYVDIPTPPELLALSLERTPASVSIYLPTTPVSGEVSGDRTVLKNLAAEATGNLAAAGHDKREIAALAELLGDLVEDEKFWRFQAHSLAIFATPSGVRTFRLPNALVAAVEVSDRFLLKPLLRSVTFPNVAYVLALAEGSVRLLEISPDLPVAKVGGADLPKHVADALGVSSMGVRTEGRRSDSPAGQRALRTQFVRSVDRAVRSALAGQDVPLFLAAEPYLAGLYRQVNSYPHLAPFGLDGTPENLTDAEVADRTRGLLDRRHQEEVAALRGLFASRSNSGRSTADIAQAARAATLGAVDTLLVDFNASVPGLVDEETGAVTFHDAGTVSNYGVVDEIARRALHTGARVLAVRSDDLPAASPLAAILRYPV
ncbi:MAG: hypothetical protein KF791_20020 [Verrucomicrobiae bacterium]|nr:hypothetical protein [Verrucomicrobiae bacterium]